MIVDVSVVDDISGIFVVILEVSVVVDFSAGVCVIVMSLLLMIFQEYLL